MTDHLIKQAGLNPSQQAAFRFLLRYANNYGFVSTGYEIIGEATNMSKSTVLRAVNGMVKNGCLILHRKGNNLKGLANEYRITLSCESMLGSEEMLAKRWYALTGKPDFDSRWEKFVQFNATARVSN